MFRLQRQEHGDWQLGLGLVARHRRAEDVPGGDDDDDNELMMINDSDSDSDGDDVQVMTLNPVCDNVETKQGVALTVTGVAEVRDKIVLFSHFLIGLINECNNFPG